MSTQSIIHNTDNKIAIQINEFFREKGQKYLLKERFNIGKDLDLSDIRVIFRLSDIFCEDSCMIDCSEFKELKEQINKLLIYSIPEL